MTNSDWISALALLVAGGALALEVRRWFESGPSLKLSVMGDAIMMPYDDGEPRLALTVRNVGNAPTTLTHMVLHGFQTPWDKVRRKPCFSAVVNNADIPFEMGINKSWTGRVLYGPEISDLRAKGQLYVGVVSAHRDRDYLIKVPPPREDIPTETQLSP